MSFVTHLECGLEKDQYDAKQVQTLSKASRPLLVKYDLQAIRASITKEMLSARPETMWRYREFLPIEEDEIVSLGEVHTPLIEIPGIKKGTGRLLIKDEGRLPTGSFKARGLAMAVAKAKSFGLRRLAMPTNGNAGAALAAYASKAGLDAYVLCPDNTPEINVREIQARGAHVARVKGLIDTCGKLIAKGKDEMGFFDVSTLKEPYRIEGKKTMGLELADQLGWQAPDVIIYPTGGGTGLIGMWKAFNELKEIGWLEKLPRMVSVQSTGCAPIVRAFEEGARHATYWKDAKTVASGIRVPAAIGDFLILDALRESGGFACAVSDEAIIEARDAVAKHGMLLCPEGAATYAAYLQELGGRIKADEEVVLFNCADGIKYHLPPVTRELDADADLRDAFTD